MAVLLRIDPALGRMVRESRERRGWSLPTMTAIIGPLGDPPRGLSPNQLTRLEEGRRNISSDEAWRLIEIFDEPEFDAWEVLKAARIVPPDSSPRLRAAVLEEAESRRRLAGNDRRWDRQLQVAEVASGQGKRSPDQLSVWPWSAQSNISAPFVRSPRSNVIAGPWLDEDEAGQEAA